MKNSNQPPLAKTVLRGRPSGEISNEDIERRAREIAVIQGRGGAEISVTDIDQAKRELSGQLTPPSAEEDVEGIGSMTRDPSNPPEIITQPKPNLNEPTEQQDIEHMVLDGVEEAQHDQMMAARKRRES
jgi:hypothetical protein